MLERLPLLSQNFGIWQSLKIHYRRWSDRFEYLFYWNQICLQTIVDRSILDKTVYILLFRSKFRSIYQRCSTIKGVLKISQNSQKNICSKNSRNFKEIFKNTFFTEHQRTAASANYKVLCFGNNLNLRLLESNISVKKMHGKLSFLSVK